MGVSWTAVFSAIFVGYLVWSLHSLVMLFYPETCGATTKTCLQSYIREDRDFKLAAFSATKLKKQPHSSDLNLLWKSNNFSIHDIIEETINVSLSFKTRNNGSLWVYVFICPAGEDPLFSKFSTLDISPLTQYAVPLATTFNLMEGSENISKPTTEKYTHWQSKLSVNVMNEPLSFSTKNVPAELGKMFRLTADREYLPLVYINQLSSRAKDLMPVNRSSHVMPLTIVYSPISVGKLRLWLHLQESLAQLRNLGFTDKDVDEVKGIFEDTNLVFLLLTFMVSGLHMLFDFLAFKNDISYWRDRDSMVGLSTRVVIWRCISTFVIFLYLLDENTSYLVLIPCGIGSLIEVWKVKKAFKMKIHRNGLRFRFVCDEASEQEKLTDEFDRKAMTYLSYVLYPLCIFGAVYSLVYNPHKSWYSWTIQSLVNGVYAFGFLFMLPQLFVNYKMKSVAHLPWRAFMYKAFNTVIDDVFAFIITMPTVHRLACFRDDVVFVIYLYQRWLYPVDKTRVNEFGQSFEEDNNEDSKKKN